MFPRVAFLARRPRSCAHGRLFSARSLVAAALALAPAPAAGQDPAAGREPDAPEASGAVQSPAPSEPAPAPITREDALIALGRDLELVVTETGPEQPWTLHLRNRGATPIGVMAEPGLLWFEVAVPGAAAPRVCRLPEPLWPTGMRRRAQATLGPGERFSRRFDPRFFCFHDLVQATLVPNARVIPHFGWPVEAPSTTAKGQKVERPSTAGGPFVAWVIPERPGEAAEADANADDEATSGEASTAAEAPWEPPTEGLKNVVGSAIVLSDTYGKWSERVPSPQDGLQVALLAGSDAEDNRAATVTVGIGNAGDEPQRVVLRRDLVSFDVRGPDGSFECPTVDLGPPDVASFSTLGRRASERFVVRLIEMCPSGSFARPGLYEVNATLHANFSGQAFGIDAFVGTVKSTRPALVRVRSGERASFLRAAPMVATGEGGSRMRPGALGAGAEPPAAGDDGGGDREAAPADEAPAPEGTSVE